MPLQIFFDKIDVRLTGKVCSIVKHDQSPTKMTYNIVDATSVHVAPVIKAAMPPILRGTGLFGVGLVGGISAIAGPIRVREPSFSWAVILLPVVGVFATALSLGIGFSWRVRMINAFGIGHFVQRYFLKST